MNNLPGKHHAALFRRSEHSPALAEPSPPLTFSLHSSLEGNNKKAIAATMDPRAAAKARTERILRAFNSERYTTNTGAAAVAATDGLRISSQSRRAEASSPSSSGTRDDSKNRAMPTARELMQEFYAESRNKGRRSLGEITWEGRKPCRGDFVLFLPKMMQTSSAAELGPRTSTKPAVLSDGSASVELCGPTNDKGYGASKVMGPRSSESMCQRLVQGGLTRRVRCNYFQIKTGKFVSPKIVKAHRPAAEKRLSLTEAHIAAAATHPKEPVSPNVLTTPRGKKSFPHLGITDRSKARHEDIKRIFKLNQFKTRTTSDLLLDDYRKRISLRAMEALGGSPRTEAALRSASATSYFSAAGETSLSRATFDGSDRNSATSCLLQRLKSEVLARRGSGEGNIRVVEDYVVRLDTN